jgi:MoaA/NifB/PqqE/SkfB family radical SAM enzyme
MPAEGDGLLKNILAWVRGGKMPRPSFPRAVEFQTLSTCNARCVFCCHRHSPKDIPHGRMEDALIRKIIAECGRHRLVLGRVSPYLTNEPLLDRRMPDIIRAIRKACGPFVKTKINTNASLLTGEMSERLINSGLSHIWISVNGYSPESYAESMGLDFATTMRNIDIFLDMKKSLRRRRPKVVISTVRTKLVEHELEKAGDYWAKRNVVFKIQYLDNRAGDAAVNGIVSAEQEQGGFKRDCDLFLKQAYIVENGDMIICCHDWRQSVVVGNVASTSIAEVWNSSYFKGLIHEYCAEKFANIEICRTCR